VKLYYPPRLRFHVNQAVSNRRFNPRPNKRANRIHEDSMDWRAV